MSERISDTTPEAVDVQREVWQRMTAEQRDELGAQLSENVRTVAAEGVRRRHPNYSNDQVRLAVIKLQLGETLFAEAYPDREILP
jgi:hypothetical protein